MAKHNKQIRKCYKYYLENVDSDAYKQYVQMREAESDKAMADYVMEKRPDLAGRTDNYKQSVVAEVKICDVLSNKGIEHVINKLYSLPKCKYSVRNYYKKSSLGTHFDYVHLQVAGRSLGRFAEIKFSDDKYINEVDIGWTQLDSFSALLEYTIAFNRCLDENLQHQFVMDNINSLSKKDFREFYVVREKQEDNFFWMLQFEQDDLLQNICQHYITSLLFSERGKEERLSNIIVMTRKEPIDINTLDLGFLCDAYFNKKDNYVITGQKRSGNYYLLAGKNMIPNFSIIDCAAKFGTNFYYDFNGERELKLFEYEFSKYSTGRKHISKKKLIALLNRLQGLSEHRFFDNESRYSDVKDRWEIYWDNEKTGDFPIDKDISEKFKKIYERSFAYFKTRAEIELASTNKQLSIIAIIIATVGVIIALSA